MKLPVGVCRTIQYNNRYQRRRNWPEDRHPYFSAHIGFKGISYAANFSIERLGRKKALSRAINWRRKKEAAIRTMEKKPHGRLGKPWKFKRKSRRKTSPS